MAKEFVPNAKYFVWEMGIRDRKKPVRQVNRKLLTLEEAKSLARIGATEGKHDRSVTTSPRSRSFELVAQYEAGTGRNITRELRENRLPPGKIQRRRTTGAVTPPREDPVPPRQEREDWRFDPRTGAPIGAEPSPVPDNVDDDGSPLEDWDD